MLKIISSLLLFFTLFAYVQEKSYVFEAKGKFAEDLKALVEKYAEDGKVNVTVRENNSVANEKSKTVTQNILSVFTNDDAEALKYASVSDGEKLYKAKCMSCHGQNADKNSYAAAHKLADLKPIQIVNMLESYRTSRDGNFGGSLRALMIPQAQNLVSDEMQSIAVYIYSIKNGKNLPTSPVNSNKENNNEPKSSYLQ